MGTSPSAQRPLTRHHWELEQKLNQWVQWLRKLACRKRKKITQERWKLALRQGKTDQYGKCWTGRISDRNRNQELQWSRKMECGIWKPVPEKWMLVQGLWKPDWNGKCWIRIANAKSITRTSVKRKHKQKSKRWRGSEAWLRETETRN